MELIEKMKSMGFMPADIMIPKSGINLEKWAVVACDQYTSEKDYWESASEFVGNAPSTLRIIYPECYLDDKDSDARITDINNKMREYLNEGLFDIFKSSFFLVKRSCNSSSRLGLIAALDLERYSWDKNSRSIIRATEGTIMSRIPPRKKIRKDALMEIPHIMVLISDKNKSIIEPLYEKRSVLKKAYETDLMKNGGHIEAWVVDSESDMAAIESAFEKLSDTLDPENPLLFAMGDGNHSFATAKSCWEDLKPTLTEKERENHPARFCLVELENIFDPGLVFEPIHRVFFNVPENVFLEEVRKYASEINIEKVGCRNCIAEKIKNQDVQRFGYCSGGEHKVVSLVNPAANIAAGTIQKVIDDLVEMKYTVDYIHGADVTDKLGNENENIGIFLPAIDKSVFFETIIKDGALPRKTFSMGEANEKRFYMESRIIR